jgi:hypothetical protein
LLKCMVHGAGTAGIAGAAAFDLSAAVRNYALLGVLEDGWRLGLCQRLGHKSGAGLVCEELLHPRLSVRRSHRRGLRALHVVRHLRHGRLDGSLRFSVLGGRLLGGAAVLLALSFDVRAKRDELHAV